MTTVKRTYQYDYPLPACTVDIVIFTLKKNHLEVLLIERRDDPFQGFWALPGGFVDVGEGHSPGQNQGETLEEAAERELREETGLRRIRDDVFLEQLYTFGAPNRDPRGRVITVAYYALISPEAYHRVEAGDDAKNIKWVRIEDLLQESLAFDHATIIDTALTRVRGKIDYDPRIVRALLPSEFTLREFRRVHEVVKGVTYDPSNFSKRFKRIVEDGKILPLNELKPTVGAGRPAKLYRFAAESS